MLANEGIIVIIAALDSDFERKVNAKQKDEKNLYALAIYINCAIIFIVRVLCQVDSSMPNLWRHWCIYSSNN